MKNGCPYPLIFFLIERKEVVLSSIWWETEKNHMRKYTAQHLFKQYTGYLFAISVGHLLEYVRPTGCWQLYILIAEHFQVQSIRSGSVLVVKPLQSLA